LLHRAVCPAEKVIANAAIPHAAAIAAAVFWTSGLVAALTSPQLSAAAAAVYTGAVIAATPSAA